MRLSFVNKSLSSRVTFRPFVLVKSVDRVEKTGAYSVEHLMQLASHGDPLPTLKSYNYMTKDSIDLSIPTHVVNDIVSLVDLSKRKSGYDGIVKDYNDKVESERLQAEKDAEKQRAIDEYKASVANEVSKSESDS